MKSHCLNSGPGKQSFGRRLSVRKRLILAAIVLLVLPSARSVHAQGLLYTVTSTGEGDPVGSNTVCDDGTGQCTLLAAP